MIIEGEGAFWWRGKLGASHCNHLGSLMDSCVEVRAAMDLSLWVVSRVGSGIGVLGGGGCAPSRAVVLGV